MRYHFDPTKTVTEVRNEIHTLPSGTVCPLGDGEIIFVDSKGCVKVEKAGNLDSFVARGVDRDDLQEDLISRLETYGCRLKNKFGLYFLDRVLQLETDSFSVERSKSSDIDSERNTDDPVVMFVTDKSDNKYFDLVVFAFRNGKYIGRVVYNHKTSAGMIHSGDIGSLLHYVKIPNPEVGVTYLVCACGYRRIALREFVEQCPTALVVGDDFHGVPLPLNQVDVGNSTFACICAMTFEESSLRVTPIRACNCEGVDTTDTTPEVIRVCEEALSQVSRVLKPQTPAPKSAFDSFMSSLQSLGLSQPVSSPSSSVISSEVVCFVEKGCEVPDIFEPFVTHKRVFGAGWDDEKPGVSLPIVFGKLKDGHSILKLGEPAKDGCQYDLESSKLIITVVSPDWSQEAADTCGAKGNGIFVIEGTCDISEVSRLGTVMAGPASMILYAKEGKLYFYAGIDYGLFVERPKFGEDVTERLAVAVPDWLSSGGLTILPVPRASEGVSSKLFVYGDKAVELDGLPVSDFPRVVKDPEICERWSSLCSQLSLSLSPAELKKASDMLAIALKKTVGDITRPYDEEIKGLIFRVTNGDETAKDQMGHLVGLRRKATRTIRTLADEIHGMTSIGSASSRGGLHRLNRRKVIDNSVVDALSKTDEEMVEMISSISQFVIGVSTSYLTNAFREISKDVLPKQPVVSLSEKCPVLDGETVGLLFEQSREFQHPLACERGVTFPLDPSAQVSGIAIAMFDCFVELKHPGDWNWSNIDDDPYQVRQYRIWLRSIFSESLSAKQFHIKSAGPQCGYLIVYTLFNLMENYAKMVGTTDNLEWDDTVPQVMRGMFGLVLSFLSSGTSCLSTAWQMVKRGDSLTVLPDDQLWVVLSMVNVMRCTLWPMDDLRRKCALLFVRMIRQRLIEPVVRKIDTKELDNQTTEIYLKQRDQELRFLGVCFGVLKHILDENPMSQKFWPEDEEKYCSMGKALLDLAPNSERQSVQLAVRFAKALSTCTVVWDGKLFEQIVFALTNLYLKKGAPFAKEKKSMLEHWSRSVKVDGSKVEYRELKKQKILGEFNKLKSYPGNSNIRLVNAKALDFEFKGYLKCDPDVRQEPWSVTGDKGSAEWVKERVESITNSESVGSDSKVVEKDQLPAEILSLVKRTSNVTVPDLVKMCGSTYEYVELYGLLGWKVRPEEIVKKLAEMWRDPLQAEKECIAMIFQSM